MMAVVGLRAQTFTAVNDDGVTIHYSVLSADDHTVEVAAASYSGRVMVPDSVVYDGATWTVTSIANAFNNTYVSYLGVPATVTSLASGAFARCYLLDTVYLASEQPVTLPKVSGYYRVERLFFEGYAGASLYVPTKVVVPCGSLRAYRAHHWDRLPSLTSPCAVPIRVVATIEGKYRFDSIVRTDISQDFVHFSNRDYEVGDTARVMVEGMNLPSSLRCLFLGWSNGETSRDFQFVVEHADTIYCIADTLHYGYLSANHITTPVYQFGSMGYNGAESKFVFEDLEGSPSTIYNTALWIGNGSKLAAQKFNSEGNDYFPGPLRVTNGTTDPQTALRYSHVWHVTREMIDYHIAHCGEAGYVIPDDIMTWPGTGDSNDGFASHLAPYYDADGNGHYWAPAGDYPLIRGDECVFSIFNDVLLPHTESGGQPLGIEIHAMTYAFNEPQDSVLWNTVFVHYDIYNRSENSYENTQLGAWTDFDIGYAWDDYIGCNVQENMYYGYNGNASDEIFGDNVPAQGCLILNREGELGMTSFALYFNSTDAAVGEPTKPADYYNYMCGRLKNGQYWAYNGNGGYPYVYPGGSDPLNWQYWDEITAGNTPGDRRGVGGSGPFTFESGTCRQFDVAYLTSWSETTDCVGCSLSTLFEQAPDLRRQWLRDTTDSGRPFTYMPYSAPHQVGVGEVARETLQVYPNPTSGVLTVVLPQGGEVQLYDMVGHQVMAVKAAAGRNTLDFRSLPQGIYLLRSAGQVQRVVRK